MGELHQPVMPPELAYSDQGADKGKAPPGATPGFEIELLGVK
ncbi:MAG: FKBP-type peptidyl-prolyl cis-trans isomerase [Chloroflexaceae bacterium]